MVASLLRADEVQFRFQYGPNREHELSVRRFTGSEGISAMFEFDIDLVGAELDSDVRANLVGQDAVLTIELPDGATRHVHGIVNHLDAETSVEASDEERHWRARLVPKLWRLSLIKRSRIFQDQTTREIVESILTEAQVEQDWPLTRDDYTKREYCVQYQETDLAFIERLLAEEGIFYFFQQDPDKHVVTFGDAREVHPDIPETPGRGPKLLFRAPSGMVQTDEFVFEISFREELRPATVTLRDFDFKRPKLDLTTQQKADGDPGPTNDPALEFYEPLTNYSEPDVGKLRAEARLQHLRSTTRVGTGASICRRLAAGHVFELEQHGNCDGRYVICSVHHHGRQTDVVGADSKAEDSQGDYRNDFSCIPLEVPFRAPRPERRLLLGIETATVVGPENEEIYVDEHGRVKVQFHWDREGVNDEKSSCWIRVSQPWAGAGWGFVFTPRIGMEVVVQFIAGDPDRPLITHCLYNGTHPPPYPLPDHKTRSTIKSQSTPKSEGYNELRFEDAAGSEQIFVHAQKDLDEIIEHDQTTKVGRHQVLKVGANRNKDVGKNEVTAIGADRTETVGANEAVSIGAQRAHLIKGQDHLTVEQERIVQITKDDRLQVGANRNTEVTEMDKTVTNNKSTKVAQTYDIDAGETFHVQQKRTALYLTDEHVHLHAPNYIRLENSEASLELTADGRLHAKAPNEVEIACGNCTIRFKDGKIEISAPQSIEIAVGETRIALGKDGLSSKGAKVEAIATSVHEIVGGIVKVN